MAAILARCVHDITIMAAVTAMFSQLSSASYTVTSQSYHIQYETRLCIYITLDGVQLCIRMKEIKFRKHFLRQASSVVVERIYFHFYAQSTMLAIPTGAKLYWSYLAVVLNLIN